MNCPFKSLNMSVLSFPSCTVIYYRFITVKNKILYSKGGAGLGPGLGGSCSDLKTNVAAGDEAISPPWPDSPDKALHSEPDERDRPLAPEPLSVIIRLLLAVRPDERKQQNKDTSSRRERGYWKVRAAPRARPFVRHTDSVEMKSNYL